jgi:hypothetical protein
MVVHIDANLFKISIMMNCKIISHDDDISPVFNFAFYCLTTTQEYHTAVRCTFVRSFSERGVCMYYMLRWYNQGFFRETVKDMVILCLHHQSDNHHIFRSFAGTKGILLHKNVYKFLDFVREKEVKIEKDFFGFWYTR